MTKTGRTVPIFNDKHLAYRWQDTKHMYDVARKLNIPFVAGSSIPITRRHPPIALVPGCKIEEAIAVFYGGLEAYGHHALEELQCMVERRQGGETEVKAVQAL